MTRADFLAQAYMEDIGQAGMSGEIKGFQGDMWKFLAKNRFRDSYADRQELTGRDGQPLHPDPVGQLLDQIGQAKRTLPVVDHREHAITDKKKETDQ